MQRPSTRTPIFWSDSVGTTNAFNVYILGKCLCFTSRASQTFVKQTLDSQCVSRKHIPPQSSHIGAEVGNPTSLSEMAQNNSYFH